MTKILLSLLFSISLFANNQEAIKEALLQKFLATYTNLQIDSLEIKPPSKFPKNFEDYTFEEIYISKTDLKKSKGNFSATFTDGFKKKKLYYTYKMVAFIDVYVAKYSIRKNHTITPRLLKHKLVKFTHFYDQPIDEGYFFDYSAKRVIKAGQIVTKRDVKENLAINSGDFVKATIRDGLVEINFRAKAIDGGNVGDIITIKRGYKKRFKAQIVAKDRVEVIE